MNKISAAVIMASLSAMAQQAYAQEVINIQKDKVSEDLVNDLLGALSQKAPHDMIGNNFKDFSDKILINGVGLGVDVSAYLAQYNQDSVRSIRTCYSNCHSACHGSRGWR